ncbi:MarR family winged helix-turn-helix transcriptional regulator [Rathayibacter sp. YIM 133350]|uniref:MarR family winged helix-turn-helix transcriptional regulator n=1 Tax=Rathayibacter sp. YIM 133350 TaxID=3131992 RepID=UPI00307F791F
MTGADTSMDSAIEDVEEQFGVLFSRVRTSWKDAAAQIHPDLQPVGYKILSTIARSGSTNAHALSELLDVDKSVVSRQVRMLEDAGLVQSEADARDGRARVLRPTPLAIERVNAVRSGNKGRLHELLRSWPESDVRAFADMLGKLTAV